MASAALVAGAALAAGTSLVHAQSLAPGASRGGLRLDASQGAGAGAGSFPSSRREFSFDTATHGLRVQHERFGLIGATDADPAVETDGASLRRFDNYRITWRYTLIDQPMFTWRVGFTGLSVDARQGPRLGTQPADGGLSPMLHAYGAWRPTARWSLIAEVDGLGLSDRRVWDLGLSARYEFAPNWHAGFGYRLLDSGTEARQWLNAGRFSGATLSVGYRF